MAVRIQFRRGTAAEWEAANPTLAAGELGYEVDTAQIKIGDGATAWDGLAYSAVSASYVDDAIASVVGLSPESLDTLEELAAAMGDDPNFLINLEDNITIAYTAADSDLSNTLTSAYSTAISDEITAHNVETTNVHGIADTSVLETTSGAQAKADAAQSAAESYADTAIANLIDSSPSTLDTLNELAAALGDDPNFATTISTALGVRITFEADTAANFTLADAVLDANTFGIETDTGKFKIGNGVTSWTNLAYAAATPSELADGVVDAKDYSDSALALHANATTSVHGISDAANLVYATQIANMATTNYVDGEVSGHNQDTVNVHGIANTADLVITSQLTSEVSTAISDHDGSTAVHGIANTLELVTGSDVTAAIDSHNLLTTNVHGIVDTSELATNSSVATEVETHSLITTNVHGIANTAELVTTSDLTTALGDYALTASPIFTGVVVLPDTTSIGNVSSGELSALDGVTSSIQTQLDGKLASSVAASTYAPLANASLTGTVSLPAGTSIGDVSADEISYLNNVSSAIQTQLDSKAPIESPTFTGTVSGVTASMVGLGDVDNTADLDKPISNATQTALDAKADLSGAIFTGDIEATDLTVTGNLIVQGTTTTVSTSDLKVKDNMIYLNQAGLSTLTDAVGDGTNVVYTTAEAHGYDVGDDVTVANTTPSSFDIASPGYSIIAVTSNTFTVASTVTDTYVSGGTVRGKVHSNPDLGWAAGRYDTVNGNGYAHAGIFRDATDGIFKIFDGYVPEPDESVFINTSDNTFALAPLSVSEITAANVIATTGIVFPDNTIQTSAGVASLTGFTEKTANYTLDTLDHKDNVVEMNSANAITFTIPTNATLEWPVGASMDIIQTGAGQVTISNAVGVTLNFTPGNKLRTTWSSCTIMKRGTDSWILYGDLTA